MKKHLLSKINKIDHNIIILLKERLKFSKEFYQEEVNSGEFNHKIDKMVLDRIEAIEDMTGEEKNIIGRIYKQLLKHEKKRRKKIHRLAIKKLRELEKNKQTLIEKEKVILKKEKEIKKNI